MGNDAILVPVVITALAFDFTNGFHDTGNAMATSIAAGALPPRIAVALSGLLNLVGAFLSLAVAATIASGLVDTKVVTLTVVARAVRRGAARPVLAGRPIRTAIAAVTNQQPSDADVARVRARLAAGGWPLAKPEQFDPANWP